MTNFSDPSFPAAPPLEENQASPTAVRSPTAPASGRPPRMLMFDAMRFIAAIAIVWQHTPESPQLSRFAAWSAFAVPFFVFGSVFFVFESYRRSPGRPLATYILSRFTRIYIPFLIWTAIYLVARDAKHGAFTHLASVSLSPKLLLTGSAHHLWFLPFIFVASIATYLLAMLICPRPALLRPAIILLAVVGLVVSLSPSDVLAGSFVLNRCWNMLPSVLWGSAFAVAYPFMPPGLRRRNDILFAAIILLVVCAAIVPAPFESMFTDNLGGLAAMVIAIHIVTPSIMLERIARLGLLAYGIYLTHVLFVEGTQAIAARAGFTHRWWLDLCVFAIAAIASTLLSLFLSKQRWGRWLIPV